MRDRARRSVLTRRTAKLDETQKGPGGLQDQGVRGGSKAAKTQIAVNSQAVADIRQASRPKALSSQTLQVGAPRQAGADTH